MPKQRRGPAPTKLSNDERIKFLDLIKVGFGIHMSLSQLKIGHDRYYKTVKSDRQFRREIAQAIRHRDEQLVATRFAQALEGDGRALDFMIGRTDRSAEFRESMALRREEIAARRQIEHSGEITYRIDFADDFSPPPASEPVDGPAGSPPV